MIMEINCAIFPLRISEQFKNMMSINKISWLET